jgi:hypothetical protein
MHFSNMEVATNDTIKCPCAMCRNYFRLKRETIEIYLCKHGFWEGYETWTEHGESHIRDDEGDSIANGEGFDEADRMDQMLIDLAGDNPPIVDEQPTPFAIDFYRMVDSASELVHEKTTHSRLICCCSLACHKVMTQHVNCII